VQFDTLLLGLLLAGTLTLLVGLIDDFGVLTPLAKLTGQGVAVFVLLRSGAVIELVDVPPALRWPLAALWILAVCNAFNLLDIMDGLAGGVGALIALALGVAATIAGQVPEAAAAFALAGALGGFLVFNVHPARIYLGDAGSLAVGITLGALALAIPWSDRSPAGFLAPLVILAVPLADTAYVTVLRARAGKPFWHGSPDHFPLRLRRRLGGDVRRTVASCWGLTLLGGVAGVGSAALWSWQVALWVLGVYGACVVVLLLWLATVRMDRPA
jgi:UDP-GlcNAc:undecaprenyl-phosphate GlcNAc-1-phosphate transferase